VTEIDLKAKFDQLELERQATVEALDNIIEAIKVLRKVDKHLFDCGLQGLQLEHVEEFPVAGVLEYLGVPDESPAFPPESERPMAESTVPKTGRRFSDEQKAEAVRMADEYGSDSKAAKECGTTATSISNWRKGGHGKKRKSVVETHADGRRSKEEPGSGPSVRCPVCKFQSPITGEISPETRANALREHYKTAPDCREALRKRHA